MFDRIVEWFMSIPESVPILLGADPHNATLVRAMAALFLIVFIIYLIGMRPFRSFFTWRGNKKRDNSNKAD